MRSRALTACISVFFGVLSFNSVGLFVPAFSASNVIGNPELIRYEGSGGLILPSSVDTGTRTEVARCRGCSWKITAACVPGVDNYCDAAIRGCPGLIDHVRTWFRPAGGEWRETGLICLSTHQVTTVMGMEQIIAEGFTRYVPELNPRCWPETGAVVNIPLLCETGQSSGMREWSDAAAGMTIRIEAQPRWVWNFEGTPMVSSTPGGQYPDMSVSHIYRSMGTKFISIQTLWSGQFSIDGLGPFPIERELLQEVGFTVEMGQARARLMRPNAGGR